MIAGLSARLKKLEAIGAHRQTRVIVVNPGPGGKERAEREIAALEPPGAGIESSGFVQESGDFRLLTHLWTCAWNEAGRDARSHARGGRTNSQAPRVKIGRAHV